MPASTEVPIAEVRSKFSEYASRSAHSHEHFIITRRGKPLAALVGLDELALIEGLSARRGLVMALQGWEGITEMREGTEDAYAKRAQQGEGRDVSF